MAMQHQPPTGHAPRHSHGSPYRTLFATVCASTAVMYALTYLNTFAASDVWFSQTRVWMALAMGSVMALVMLIFMRSMYADPRKNVMVVALAVGVFAIALWLVRSQQTVRDVAYMEAMIPHHSIAVLTSSRAHIRDPRVRLLADGIIRTQRREIAEMEALIAELERHPPPDSAADLPPPRATTAAVARECSRGPERCVQ